MAAFLISGINPFTLNFKQLKSSGLVRNMYVYAHKNRGCPLKMYCTYHVTEISMGQESPRYLERMDKQGNVVPFLPDGIAYVTIQGDYFTIKNNDGEVLAIGKSKMAMDNALRLLKPRKTLVNGVNIDRYYAQFAPLIYHIKATKPDKAGKIYAVMTAEQDGFIQGNWQFVGREEFIIDDISSVLHENDGEFLINYVAGSYRFIEIQRSETVPQSPFNRTTLNERLKEYKKREESRGKSNEKETAAN